MRYQVKCAVMHSLKDHFPAAGLMNDYVISKHVFMRRQKISKTGSSCKTDEWRDEETDMREEGRRVERSSKKRSSSVSDLEGKVKKEKQIQD